MSNNLNTIAEQLFKATHDKKVCDLNFTHLTTQQAYEVQDALLELNKLTFNDIGCWKLGAANIEQTPICAPIYPSLVFRNDDTINVNNFINLSVELEWGYYLIQDIHLSEFENKAFDEIMFSDPIVCFELVDSRLDNINALTSSEKLADNQLNAGIVISEKLNKKYIHHAKNIEHELMMDHKLIFSNKGGHPLVEPSYMLKNGLSVLLNRVKKLKKGTLILTGSFNGMHEVGHHKTVFANFNKDSNVQFHLEVK